MAGGEVVKRCPYTITTPRLLQVVQCASMVECGILPDRGPWLDHAAILCDALCLVATLRDEYRQDKVKQ